jgi:hypothetical protein
VPSTRAQPKAGPVLGAVTAVSRRTQCKGRMSCAKGSLDSIRGSPVSWCRRDDASGAHATRGTLEAREVGGLPRCPVAEATRQGVLASTTDHTLEAESGDEDAATAGAQTVGGRDREGTTWTVQTTKAVVEIGADGAADADVGETDIPSLKCCHLTNKGTSHHPPQPPTHIQSNAHPRVNT